MQSPSDSEPRTESQNERNRVFSGWFTAGIGLLALALSIGLLVEQHRFTSTALRTEGVVKKVWNLSDPQRSYSVVQYHVGDKAFEIHHELDLSGVASNLGERVTVL